MSAREEEQITDTEGKARRAPEVGTPEGLEPVELAREMAALVDSKLGTDVVAIEIGELVAYAELIIVATAKNERQARAIVDEVQLEVKRRHGALAARVEGSGEAGWMLVDYVDVVLHVFLPEARERYRLESLWGDAPRVELGLDGGEGETPPEPDGGDPSGAVRRSA